MPGLNCSTCDGDLSIDGTAMRGPGWCIVSPLTPLWQPAPKTGGDLHLPGVDGDRAYEDDYTGRTVQLDLLIGGAVNQAGVAHPDPWTGLELNIASIAALVLKTGGAYDPVTGTRPATLTKPSGAALVEPIHVDALELGRVVRGHNRGAADVGQLGTLVIRIPSGRFQ